MRVHAHHLNATYLGLLILIVSLYVGCESGNTNNQALDYRHGSQALEIQMLTRNTNTYYEGEHVSILFELRNRGTYDVKQGLITISGFDPNILPLRVVPSNYFDLKGKDEFDPNGDFPTTFTLETTRPIALPIDRDRITQPVQIKTCYEYRTFASAEICIDPDPNNRRIGQKSCQLGASGFGAQGHPVIVSSVIPRVNNKDLRLQINLQNAGGGIIFDPTTTSVEECAEGLRNEDVDKIVVDSVRLSNVILRCEPHNPVRLRTGASYIMCECTDCVDPNMNSFTTVLQMEFSYGYQNTQSTQLTLLRN